jgi:hypothetical protein
MNIIKIILISKTKIFRPFRLQMSLTTLKLAPSKNYSIKLNHSKMVKQNPHFSPDWDDASVLLPESLLYPLRFPSESLRSEKSRIWVTSKWMRTEEWRGREVVLERPRNVAIIMRPPEISETGLAEFRNQLGKSMDPVAEKVLFDRFFPPRGWMADTLVERSMMLLGAREAKGKVLVGGLGLGIYPQIVLYLKRPVTSITIVETHPDVIRLIEPCLTQFAQSYDIPVRIVPDTIENFMQNTNERFDTIYLDTWGDLHYKFLGYINYLVSLASKIATPEGKIQCWGYNFMYKEFLKVAVHVEQNPSEMSRFPTKDNPCLKAYLAWRKARSSNPKPSLNVVRFTAAKFAVETVDSTPLHLFIDESNLPTFNHR